jgi:hypothetical protein
VPGETGPVRLLAGAGVDEPQVVDEGAQGNRCHCRIGACLRDARALMGRSRRRRQRRICCRPACHRTAHEPDATPFSQLTPPGRLRTAGVFRPESTPTFPAGEQQEVDARSAMHGHSKLSTGKNAFPLPVVRKEAEKHAPRRNDGHMRPRAVAVGATSTLDTMCPNMKVP